MYLRGKGGLCVSRNDSYKSNNLEYGNKNVSF